MTRRVTVHKAESVDHEELVVWTVYEPGLNKEQVKKINRFSKRHYVLIDNQNGIEWL